MALIPAAPTVNDMLNCRAQIVFRKPYACSPIIANVTVTEVRQYRGVTFFSLKPDASHLTGREMSEFEFIKALIRYLPKTEEAATAA